MPYKIFRVPSYGCEVSEQALNRFLANYKVLRVTQEFVHAGVDSFWSFCVDYLEQSTNGQTNQSGRQRSKVDYKEILDPDEFALFARLRELRKELSQAEAVPVYTIFTNEQLARIVRNRVVSLATLRDIPGLGDARIGKYGQRVIDMVKDHWRQAHAASGTPI